MTETTGNRLHEAVSPYLLQHRDNPVHWRQWNAETLAEAAALDRPILLSVGYAACHWCHVMAHESFEDGETAAVMNRLFVNVKVDREERPDIDHLYMSALHAMGEQGGWPMTMFLTPDGKPFYGGTYYPKRSAHGRPGFVEVMEAVGAAWQDRRPRLAESAEALTSHLGKFLARPAGESEIGANALGEAANRIAGMVDPRLGGMKGAPRFPNAPYFEILARSGFPKGPPAHRGLFLTTLTSLCEGGIYDHLGGGLHRYSVDDRWLVPHFEKMLYDNAQFLRHLLWGWRATGKALYRERMDETVGWLEREMLVEDGGLAASLDADSLDESGHSHEGAYYVWTQGEVDRVLGPDALDFRRRYDVTPTGNWEGKTVLSRLEGFGSPDWRFEAERAALLQVRDGRSRPGRDDKVLADWNGLAIRALADIHAATGDARAGRLAANAFAFVMRHLWRDGRLHHAVREGVTSGPALSSDYGAMLAAAASLFAATLDPLYLEHGRRLADALETWHGDGDGGHLMTARDAGDVLLPLRGDTDDAVPSPTSLVVEGLAILAQASGDPALLDRAERAGRSAAARIAESPAAFPGILAALDRLDRQSELALFGAPTDAPYAALAAVADRALDLSRLELRPRAPGALPPGLALASLTPERVPAAVFCSDRSCRPPVYEAAHLASLLEAG